MIEQNRNSEKGVPNIERTEIIKLNVEGSLNYFKLI